MFNINSPLVSIIVPVFNIEKDLPSCIESILRQSFTNFELILVDDGSLDSSGDICDEFGNKDSRIVVVHKKNSGVSDSRNVGIKMARGLYLSFIDGDDLVHRDFLSILLRSIDGCQISMCYFERFFDVEPEIAKSITFNKLVVDERGFWNTNFGKGFRASCCNKLFLASLFADLNFDTTYVFAEDDLLIHRLVGRCTSISIVDACLYFYRSRSESLTHNRSKEGMIKNTIAVYLDRCFYYYEKKDILLLDKWYFKCFDLIIKNYMFFNLKCEWKLLKRVYKSKRSLDYSSSKTEKLFFMNPHLFFCLSKLLKKRQS